MSRLEQARALAAEGFSKSEIGRRLGIPRTTISDWLNGTHPAASDAPDGFRLKGVSTLYGPDGEVKGQWIKTSADDLRQREMVREAMAAMVQDLPQIKPRTLKAKWQSDLLTGYPIGDPHIGMRAWRDECGQDWDLTIAEQTHCDAMASLVEAAPPSETGLVVNLGDLFHYDSMAAVTPRSGHMLDADGRYAKMIRVGIKVMRQCIESALTKHRTVHVINSIGNHDETGAIWLSEALSHVYEREPRVVIDRSPSVFNYHRFGANLIGVHHGHTCKPDRLPGVMAADRAKDWGETRHRYWWQGHIHHASVREYPGVIVESFGTMASRDAYATAGGWRSREAMQSIILHREHGEVGRNTRHAEMFREAA